MKQKQITPAMLVSLIGQHLRDIRGSGVSSTCLEVESQDGQYTSVKELMIDCPGLHLSIKSNGFSLEFYVEVE